MTRQRIDLVVGTRPNIVKLGPLAHELSGQDWCEVRLVILQQHQHPLLVDDIMSDLALDVRRFTRIAIASSAWDLRFGEMMAKYGELVSQEPPCLTVVFGDVDATLATAYAAKRAAIPVAHVEAGLRSHDFRMPEELNRRMTDAISDLLFATTEDAMDQLASEGRPREQVHFAGNLMIDALVRTVDRDHGRALCGQLNVPPGQFALATFHRPSNVDDPYRLRLVLEALRATASRLPVLLPLHPRTAQALREHSLEREFHEVPGLHLHPPFRYRDFVALLANARVALTDSGGLQEETTHLGIPCLTIRENTERPVTVHAGTNRLIEPQQVNEALDAVLSGEKVVARPIAGWDGRAAQRIATVLRAYLTRDAAKA